MIWLISLLAIDKQYSLLLLYQKFYHFLKSDRDRLFVKFNGLGQHQFKSYCDRRQLHWFQRFAEDQQVKKAGKNSHSSGLFILQSAKIAWQEGKKKNTGKPWNDNRIILFCTVDTRFWSAQRTQIATKEKEAKILKTIDNMKHKEELTASQSEVKAKAEAKIPGYEEGQKKYAKQYRINIHNWSYGRLIENITNQTNKSSIAIAEVKQPVRRSPTEKARDIAIAWYNKNIQA